MLVRVASVATFLSFAANIDRVCLNKNLGGGNDIPLIAVFANCLHNIHESIDNDSAILFRYDPAVA